MIQDKPSIGDPINPNYYCRRIPVNGSTVKVIRDTSGNEVVEIQVIDIIEAWELHKRHLLATAVQYILRGAHKEDQKQDIKKARWFLERWIKNHEDPLPSIAPIEKD